MLIYDLYFVFINCFIKYMTLLFTLILKCVVHKNVFL